ncbi:MAG TPA: glycosyltransferase [Trinickia sp.]|jgi:glycosyltransferase involved in cell wall biosynthesis|nr:glycosyltransferase [Trinickia sp.]
MRHLANRVAEQDVAHTRNGDERAGHARGARSSACAKAAGISKLPSGAAPRPLRVALVVEAAGGGVAVHLADLIEGLATRDVEVHLIAPEGSRFDAEILTEDIVRRCASVARIPMLRAVSWRDALAFFHVFRELVRIDPDIVHSHSSKAGVLARACLGRWRQVYTPHAFYTLNPYLARGARRFYRTIEQWFGRLRTHRLIAVSNDEAAHARNELSLPDHLTTIVHNGVPAFPLLPRAHARQALGLAYEGFTVGFVGRFSFQKGVDRLVAAAKLLEVRFGTRIEIALIGIGDIEAASGVAARDLPRNVRLVGKQPDARRYFAAFDLFVLPSRYEGFPYVYLEAMSARLPVVTTRVAGSDELVAAERIGVVVENADDALPLAEAISALFQDDALRGRLSENCSRAIRRFSAARMVQRTLDVYYDVVEGVTR